MRFTNLLTLLAASSALALKFKRDDQLEKIGQMLESTQNDQTTAGSQISQEEMMENMYGEMFGEAFGSKECIELSTNMGKLCYGTTENTVTKSKPKSDEESCKRFNTKECQAILDDIVKCGDAMNALRTSIKMVCSVDEKGNLCPIAKSEQEQKEFTDKDIDETCKSKKCTEEAISIIEDAKKQSDNINKMMGGEAITQNDMDELDKTLKALKDDKCKAAATSGATQIKVGSALLATLALAFYFF